LSIDFGSQTESAYVNSLYIGTVALPNASTGISQLSLGLNPNASAGTDTGFFDSLSVTSSTSNPPSLSPAGAAAPEPGYAGLVVAGLGLMALRSRKMPHSTEPRA